MSQLQFNITKIDQLSNVDTTGANVGDVLTITSLSPFQTDFAPSGGGTGTVTDVKGQDPIWIDNTDPAAPKVNIYDAANGVAGAVSVNGQEFSGKKIFLDGASSSSVPTGSDDLTNKAYVDTFAAGLQVKAAVRAATLVSGTLASSFQNGSTIDGVVLATNDRILIKNQASAIENGIYTVNASGAPTRAADYYSAGEANAGTFTTVTEGGQKNTQWVQVNTGTPAPGTDALNFSRLNISGNVNTIQSPNTAHGTGGTLTGAVKLDSTDIYYSGYSGSTVKTVLDSKVALAGAQTITGNKTFTAVNNFTGTVTAPTQTIGDSSTRVATTQFVQTALASSSSLVMNAKISLTAAQILNSGDGFSPVNLISAPGANKVIDLINVVFKFNYVSSVYTMPGQISLRTRTANKGQILIPPQMLSSNAFSYISHFNGYANSADPTLIANEPLQFVTLSGNPTVGDSTVDLYLLYRIVTL